MKHFTDEELQDHVDGSSTPGLDQHLRECAMCSNKVQIYLEVREGLQNMNRPTSVPDVETPVMMRIMKMSRAGRSADHFVISVLVLFSLLLVGSIIAFFFTIHPAQMPSLDRISGGGYRDTLDSVIDAVMSISGWLLTTKGNYVLLGVLSLLLSMSIDLGKIADWQNKEKKKIHI